MIEIQKLKKLISTLIKGSPIIAASLIIALFIAKMAIQYSTPKYQSVAKIKLDDQKYGFASNNLYSDFDVFSSENKIETEAEILKSPLLIGKTIDVLNLNVQIYRIGSLKKTFLYKDNPFLFNYSMEDEMIMDKDYFLDVTSKKSFKILNEEEETITSGYFGETFNINGSPLTISLNDSLLNTRKLEFVDRFQFRLKSRDGWISTISKDLDVKAIDKEIAVLRVVFKSENPYFSADLSNSLCQMYVEDYIQSKSLAATKTLSFIDERMNEIKKKLSQSEDQLEAYKIHHDVVNTTQETETGLREISKLRLQLINLETEEHAVIDLENYISAGNYYEETSINFGFGDLTLTELVKKLKLYSDEKRDLLMKYTESDQRVINTQNKIDDIEEYIKEAVKRNKETIVKKRNQIQIALDALSLQFEDLPTRQKEMRGLEREFQINESVYSFLAQKKLEAQIASSALISFHRIIQPAVANKEPISPNKVLITFVCGLLGILFGILIAFSRKLLSGKLYSKSDVEKITDIPILGAITSTKDRKQQIQEFASLIATIKLKENDENNTFLVTSSTKNEGKSFITDNMAKIYNNTGYRVAKLNFNVFSPAPIDLNHITINELLDSENPEKLLKNTADNNFIQIGITDDKLSSTIIFSHKNITKVLNLIKDLYQIVIIDTPGSVISIDAQTLLRHVDRCFYIVRAKYSKAEFLPNINFLKEDAEFENMSIVLNGVHSLTNYSGNFYGSQLKYTGPKKGLINKIKHLFKAYSQ